MSENTGRSKDHPAEITRREGAARAGSASFRLRGFYNPTAEHGAIAHVFGDPEKFAADMARFQARERARWNGAAACRWWIEAH